MDLFQRFFGQQISYGDADREAQRAISEAVRGYSGDLAYAVFKHLVAVAGVRRVLVLGVYFGRDICFLCSAASSAGVSLSVTGVDKFSDDFCDDWPEERRALSWREAGYGPAPTLERARANVAGHSGGHRVELIRQRDDAFLAACRDRFDLVYLDTAHDYETVRRQLRQAKPLLEAGGLFGGDDYSDEGTWGVRRALAECAPGHRAIRDWIWLAPGDRVAAD